MRTAIILLFTCVFISVAETGYTQNAKVTLNKNKVILKEVLNEIENQTDYLFIYNNEVNTDKTVSVKSRNGAVSKVLTHVLKDSDIDFLMEGNHIILSYIEAKKEEGKENITKAIEQQGKTVTGKVTDINGESLPGVTVLVKGTSKGTITDVDGNFTLANILENESLQFSFVGMDTQDVTVKNKNVINVSMMEGSIGLDEVVAVGYGTIKKRNLLGSSATFKPENIQERPLTRVDQALVGQMAGVQVKQTTGVPGKAFSIQIRGTGSISAGNEPLYVIDGFPLASANPSGAGDFATGNPLDNINPNDIESIQVLKDAAAAAIYGSRAGNGVVLITTKKGKTGKPSVTFNTHVGFVERSRKLDVLNAEEWIDRATEMINSAWIASGTGRTDNQTTEERRQILGLTDNAVNTDYMLDDRWFEPNHPGLYFIDWQDETFRKGLVQSYQLSVSGGTSEIQYYASGNYTDQKGMVIGMDYKSYDMRANLEINASKNIKIGFNIAPAYSITNNPGYDNFPVEGKDGMLQILTGFTPVQEDLPENVNVFNYGSYAWSSAGTNDVSPVSKLKNLIGLTKRFRTISSAFMNYEIIDGLNFKITLNLDNTDNTTNTYDPYTVRRNLATRETLGPIQTNGSFTGLKKQTFVNENTISYDRLINDIHNISMLVGTSYNSDRLDYQKMSSDGGYSSSVITTLNAANGVKGITTATKNVLLSHFGRLQYGFKDKYLLSTSIRRDGSSRFGSNTKWGLFPSASIGWRISQEKFMNNIMNYISMNDLKLRVSWGYSGNYNIGDYSTIATLGTYNYILDGIPAIGKAPNIKINPDLSWEKSKTQDVGLDIGLFDNRISASFDYYEKLNTDLLLNVPIPSISGFTTSLNNTGKVKNRGWELELTSRNITGEFQWTTSLNITHNTNKLVELADGQNQIIIPSRFDLPHSIMKIGEPIYSIYVVKQIGLLTQEDIANGVALYGTQKEGDPKYFDANKDGTIDGNDRVISGHPTPDYMWGVTNSFKFKGFDLSILIQGQTGGSIYSLFGRAVGRTDMGYKSNVIGAFRDRWRSPSNPGNGEIGKAYSTFGRIINTDWLYSSDYFLVRNITLGYDLRNVLKGLNLQGSRIYLTAENFFGYDKYTGGYNPEAVNADLSGSTLFPEPGDYGGLPLPKSLVLGINIIF